MSLRSPGLSKYHLWLMAHVAVSVSLCVLMNRSMFDEAGPEAEDGFASQMLYVAGVIAGEQQDWAENPLVFVYLARFIVAAPFFWLSRSSYGSAAQILVLCLFLWPVLTASFSGRYFWLQALVVYLPVVVSFRAVLTACSIGYLFVALYGDKARARWLPLGLLLANLSSAAVLGWTLIVMANFGSIRRRLLSGILLGMLVLASASGFVVSATDKYIGFGEGRPGYAQSTVESENPLLAAVSRNTVSVSVASGDYARAVVYLGVVCAAGAILAALIASRRVPRSIRRFFACAVPGFFFEGLGVLAFLIPVYWFLIGVRPSEAPEHRARETPGKRALRAT